MVGWEGAFTITTLAMGLVVLFRDWAGPDFVFLGMLACLMAAKIINVEEGLEGFANEAPLTVAVLFVVASGISETGGLDHIFSRLLGKPTGVARAMVRLMIPVAIVSAFMNNTPVVAILIPIVNSWCQKADLPPGQMFIPLSFSSLLGGTTTLIGTSTNLVVAGQQEDAGEGRPGFFDIGKYGVPVAIWGLIYMVVFAPVLLPGRSKGRQNPNIQSSFLVGLQVPTGSRAAGKTVADAGLRGLEGLFLASVRRGPMTLSAVGPEFVVAEHDILFFAGVMDNVQSVAEEYNLRPITDEYDEEIPGLLGSPKRFGRSPRHSESISTVDSHLHEPLRTPQGLRPSPSLERISVEPMGRLLEATIKDDATIIGQSIKDIGFRRRFNAAIVAVTRDGTKVPGRLGDVVLQAKDRIIMNGGQEFDDTSKDVEDNLADVKSAGSKSDKEFMVAMTVLKGGPLVGKTVEKAGLRGLPQLFLVEIERTSGRRIPAVPPDEKLQDDDILWFAGVLESVASLRKIPGLAPYGDQVEKLTQSRLDRRLVQAVISPLSSMVGSTIRQIRFRTRYHAAIIGVHRQGQRLRQKIGDITLKGGDVLLLDTGAAFVRDNKNNRNFALVSEVENSTPPRFDRVVVSLTALAAMVLTQLVGIVWPWFDVSLITAALFAAALMLAFQCLSGEAARASVKWDVVTTIAAAFGISAAMENSGMAKEIADSLVSGGKAVGGDFPVMLAVYLATMLLSNLVANNAVAALMFPIASDIAAQQEIDPGRMSALLMMAASAAFMSPFGYQTNLMVYASGGYTIRDFVKFGAPMQLWQMAATMTVFMLDEQWHLVWMVSGAAGFLILGGPQARALLTCGCLRKSKPKKMVASKPAGDGREPLLGPGAGWRTESAGSGSDAPGGAAAGATRGGGVYTVDGAIDAIGVGRFQAVMFVLVGMAFMGEAAKQTVVAFVGPVIKCELGLSEKEQSLITTLNFAGMIFGSYAWGTLSDLAGRKFAFFGVCLVGVLSSLLAACMPELTLLTTFLTGLGFTAFSNILGETFLVEYLPGNHRGLWCVAVNIFWGIGILLTAVCAWTVMPWKGWRFFLAFINIPYLIILLLWPLIPESAHFLVVMGEPAKARKALSWVAWMNGAEMPSGRLLVPPQHHNKSNKYNVLLKMKEMLQEDESMVSRPLWATTAAVMMIWAVGGALYFSLVLMTTEIHTVGPDEQNNVCQDGIFIFSNKDYLDVLIVSSSELLGNFIPIFFVEWAGRKRSMLAFFCVAAAGILPMLALPISRATWPLFVARALAQSILVLIILYTPEAYPTEMRSSATGIGNMLNSLASLAAPAIGQELLHRRGLPASAGVLIACCGVGAAAAATLPKDTAGRALQDVIEEVEEEFERQPV
eukprot:evm.model.scf_164.7 EVM.evm.TU.scf_164.7   scf_164:94260-120106(+)